MMGDGSLLKRCPAKYQSFVMISGDYHVENYISVILSLLKIRKTYFCLLSRVISITRLYSGFKVDKNNDTYILSTCIVQRKDATDTLKYQWYIKTQY